VAVLVNSIVPQMLGNFCGSDRGMGDRLSGGSSFGHGDRVSFVDCKLRCGLDGVDRADKH
jgi:hypothetical protein